MTRTETKLILRALVAILRLQKTQLHALSAYHDSVDPLIEEIEATVDSMTAEEVDAVK